ncbi:MAG: extracellular solute-binding protein family 1 [Clostridia bacterium]|jgi:multiple sugar transport system substrate-binding protein|nr:extracellular solute-binding protein family 1 [Clostridia bacterium]
MTRLKILAVADPAVKVYVDDKYNILGQFEGKDTEIIFDIVPWESYFPTMMKAFEGHEDYDIVMVAGHLWLADFANKGYLAPIGYDFEDILPVIAKEMQYNETTYLSPSFCDGHMLVYRKSILEGALKKLPQEVIHVDELIEIANTLKAAGISNVLALKAHQSEILLDALPYLRSSGVDVYSEKDNFTICNIDQMTDGFEKYLSLRSFAPKDTHTYGNDEIKNLIAQKETAMAVTWSGQLGAVLKECIQAEDLGFATFDTAWNVTWSFAVTSASQNKQKAEAFLSYLRSKEVDKLTGEYSGAPVRRINYIEGSEKFPWYKVQLKMIEDYAKPFINVLGVGVKNDILYEEIHHAFINKKDPVEALLNAKSRIDSI